MLWIAASAHDERFIRWQNKTVGKKNRGFHGVIQAVVFCIADYTDDFEPIVRRLRGKQIGLIDLEHRAADTLADGIEIAEILLHEGLIHHGEMSGALGLGIVENSSAQQRNAQRREQLRTDERQNGLRVRQCRFALHFNFCVEASETGEPRCGNACFRHSRRLRDDQANHFVLVDALLPGRCRAFR